MTGANQAGFGASASLWLASPWWAWLGFTDFLRELDVGMPIF